MKRRTLRSGSIARSRRSCPSFASAKRATSTAGGTTSMRSAGDAVHPDQVVAHLLGDHRGAQVAARPELEAFDRPHGCDFGAEDGGELRARRGAAVAHGPRAPASEPARRP